MINISNLSKSYGELIAVNNISFEIKKGELFGFLGPNGAGKSTTINMISGVLSAGSGTILIENSQNPSNTDIRKRIGVAPQSLAIYDELTGFENISFFGKLYGLSGKKLKN